MIQGALSGSLFVAPFAHDVSYATVHPVNRNKV